MAKESTFWNMVLCLFIICFVCSGILGVVYAITEEPIHQAQVAKVNKAISLVVPPFDNVPSEEAFEATVNGKVSRVYPASMRDTIVGYAIESATSKGFGGSILLMVGFDVNGNIYNTSVISHSETPGLGAKMVLENFYSQFKGKNPATYRLAVRKDGGDIDAITAATITSRAYADALIRANDVYKYVINK